MALLYECTPKCARKLLDTADIVRDAMLQQLSLRALFYNRRGRRRMHPNRWLLAILLLSILSLAGRVHAAEEIVELRLQRAKCLCGIVTYVNGDPVPDAQVEERGQTGRVPNSVRPRPIPKDVSPLRRSRAEKPITFKSLHDNRVLTPCEFRFRSAAFEELSCCVCNYIWLQIPSPLGQLLLTGVSTSLRRLFVQKPRSMSVIAILRQSIHPSTLRALSFTNPLLTLSVLEVKLSCEMKCAEVHLIFP